ncbi:hypothetical protein Bbelb_443360 [Branchiostoma belcheri]|nr:hypothetical protein Bbelb_443360 [Branchiostoma belcheri]
MKYGLFGNPVPSKGARRLTTMRFATFRPKREVKPGQTVSGPGLCGSTLPCQRLRDNVSSGHQVSASSFQPSTNPTSLNSPGGIPCCPSGAPCPVAGAKAVSGEDGQRLIEKTPTFNARVRSFTSRRPFCTQPKRECTLQDAGFFPLYSQ